MAEDFLQAFRCARLQPGQFGHKDHVFAAWLMLRELPLDLAATEYAACIRRIAAKFDVAEKFHATITQALMILISDRYQANQSWDKFWKSNPDIAKNAMPLLSMYYSKDYLNSDMARATFVPPDLMPLPGANGSAKLRSA